MLQQPAFSKSQPGYEQIGYRVQRIIADPKVQRIQFVTVGRLPEERIEDWMRLIEEISETAGVRVEHEDEDTIRIGWGGYIEA